VAGRAAAGGNRDFLAAGGIAGRQLSGDVGAQFMTNAVSDLIWSVRSEPPNSWLQVGMRSGYWAKSTVARGRPPAMVDST
jgi:hypothetical protein